MLRSFIVIILITALFGCSSVETESIFNSDPLTNANWISGVDPIPESDSLLYLDHPAPLLRKEFKLKKKPSRAELWITAAGYYTVWVNGNRVGDLELAPAWTDYSKRIYYRKLDVAKYLNKGKNVIGIELGNGWYNPLPLKMWGNRNLRKNLAIGKPTVLANLTIDANGNSPMVISTDQSWKHSQSSVTRNNIYLGEYHDLRNDPKGWNNIGFDDSNWNNVELSEAPGGELVLGDFPPIKKTATIKPQKIWQNGPGRWTVDFGQNMAGWIKYQGPTSAGDSIKFRFGELIWTDSTVNTMTAVCGQIKRAGVGGPGAPAIAEQVDVFIPTEDSESFEPRYTFHGFRYVEITMNPATSITSIDQDDLIAYRVGSNINKIGNVESSLDWMNDIQEMVEWTFTSNIFSVISDCPAREKFGYGGDLNATAETWLYNYDMKAIFVKFMRDWKDAMKDGKFVDTAPSVGIEYCGVAWESSFMMIQDWLFKFYGDVELVREWYSYNKQWMQKTVDIIGIDLARNGLSDHESLLRVPVELIGTATYYQSLRVMQKFAAVLGNTADVTQFKSYADQIQVIMRDSLWYSPIKEMKNKQTWISTLLYHKILPPTEHEKALNILLSDLSSRGNQLTTGIFGTAWLLDVLSSHGQVQLAFDMVARKEFPGWRHMLDNGATTLWETWKQSDNTFSQNHPMFGVVSAWFHKWIGGIDPVDGGFSRIMVHPAPVNGLNEFSVTRNVSGNEISVSWKRSGDKIVFDLHVPDNTQVVWSPQLLSPNELETIMGPDGTLSTSDKPQIIFNDPGNFKITYKTSRF